MTLTIDLPSDLEAELRQGLGNLDHAARLAFIVELCRQGRITPHQASRALAITRLELDAVLKAHGVYFDLSLGDVLNEAEISRQARGK